MERRRFNWRVLALAVLGLAASACQSGEPEARLGTSTDKIQPEVADEAATGAQVEVLVRLRGDTALDDLKLPLPRRRALVKAITDATLGALGGDRARVKRRFRHLPELAMTVDASALQRLAALPMVARVEKNRRAVIMTQQGGPLIGANSVRTAGVSGAGQTVAILDTGIDYTHPALGGGFGPSSKVVGGYDFVNDDADPMDDQGHGTSVAGIVASTDVANTGVAPDAKLVALKVMDENGVGSFDAVDAAFDWILDNRATFGISVANLSLGTEEVYPPALCDLDATADWISLLNANGIPVFVSSGNSGCDDGVSFPACVSAAFSIGAVYDANIGGIGFVVPSNCTTGCVLGGPDPCCFDFTTSADKVTCYSNAASNLDFLAPSHNAVAPALGGGYNPQFGGTSAASPYAAGAAALLLDMADNALAPAQIRASFTSTGTQILDPRNNLSFPRINVFAAAQNLNGCFAKPSTEACDDGNDCTSDDHCDANQCAGTAIVCNDGNDCTDDTCNPAGGCVYTDNQAACDDGDPCTTQDECSGGSCAGTAVTCPDDGDPCTDAVCDAVTGCGQEFNTADCDDGNECTENDQCADGVCSGEAFTCPDDGDVCTTAVCDPLTGCVHESIADTCADENPCTDDFCHPVNGCQHEDNTAACVHPDPCVVGDICADGACSGTPKDCDDLNPCTADSCDSGSGDCEHEPATDWIACGVEQACFSGTCETLPGGDGCGAPIALSLGVAHAGNLAGHHDFKAVPGACDGAPGELVGADAFHTIELEPGIYDIELTPTGASPPDLALALWNDCDGGSCLAAAEAGDGVETIDDYEIEATSTLVIQTKAVSPTGAEATYSLLVTVVTPGTGGTGGVSGEGGDGGDAGAGGDGGDDEPGAGGDNGAGAVSGTGGNASGTGGNTSGSGGSNSSSGGSGNTSSGGDGSGATSGSSAGGTAGKNATSGSGGDAGATNTAANERKSADSSGCGCRVPGSSARDVYGSLGLLLGLTLLARRRSRRHAPNQH